MKQLLSLKHGQNRISHTHIHTYAMPSHSAFMPINLHNFLVHPTLNVFVSQQPQLKWPNSSIIRTSSNFYNWREHCLQVPLLVLWTNVLSDGQSSELSLFDNDRSSFRLTFTAIHWRRAFVKHWRIRRTCRCTLCNLCWKWKPTGACYFISQY